ncbi:MAG: hypothetical protein FWE31_03495 [Firmicutes bacterium]|nr:hypothetical protein [Bacillota bacterium]
MENNITTEQLMALLSPEQLKMMNQAAQDGFTPEQTRSLALKTLGLDTSISVLKKVYKSKESAGMPQDELDAFYATRISNRPDYVSEKE